MHSHILALIGLIRVVLQKHVGSQAIGLRTRPGAYPFICTNLWLERQSAQSSDLRKSFPHQKTIDLHSFLWVFFPNCSYQHVLLVRVMCES